MSSREDRLAENEYAFRTANERFSERAAKLVADETPVPFLCECVDDGCLDRIEMSLAEYRGVRAHAKHFMIIPGHSTLVDEPVVRENDRFQVVHKGGE